MQNILFFREKKTYTITYEINSAVNLICTKSETTQTIQVYGLPVFELPEEVELCPNPIFNTVISVTNPEDNYTYEWFVDNTSVGTGVNFNIALFSFSSNISFKAKLLIISVVSRYVIVPKDLNFIILSKYNCSLKPKSLSKSSPFISCNI